MGIKKHLISSTTFSVGCIVGFIIGIIVVVVVGTEINTVYKTKEVCEKSDRELLIESAKDTCGNWNGIKSVETFSDNSRPQIKFECK